MSLNPMRKAIAEFDPNGRDDGDAVHQPVPCMMSSCAHAKTGNEHRCRTLGQCGCHFALDKAREPGGYRVITRDNPVKEALLDAELCDSKRGHILDGTTRGDYNTTILIAK